jgi:hypothetical protein
MAVRARILDEFQTGVDPDGDEIPVIDGDVTFDADARILSTLDLTTEGHEARHVLAEPYGTELYVERGVYYGDETIEWVGLGYFRLDTVGESSVSLGNARILAKDRMAQVIDERLSFPKVFPKNTTVQAIFNNLIMDVYPDAVIEYDFGTELFIDRTHVCERDRYDFLRELATARGKIFYFDYRGVLVVKDRPVSTAPVFTVSGGSGGVLLEPAHEELSREGTYNGVVAFGEGTDEIPPVRKLAYNADSQSKTYWYGKFGQVPRFFFSPFITTSAQAYSAAVSILDRVLGEPYRLDLSIVPNPALEVFDTLEIILAHHTTRRQMMQTMRIPLSPEQPMIGNTKDKAGVDIGEED